MNKNKRFVVICLSILLVMTSLFAASTVAGNVKLILSTAPEVKTEVGYNVKIPLLQGNGPLFSGNNLKVKGLLGVSPIAATLAVDAVFTPIAVMEISAGGAIGTGWDFPLMEIEGLRKWDGVATEYNTDTMGGVYYKARAGVALQFDTAAIWPGDWTSILLRTYHEVNYQGYSNASSSTSGGWEYETGGLHQNGMNYKGEYVLGYHLPFMVDTVALMLETYADNIGNSLELPKMVFDLGLIMNIQFTDKLNLTVIPQFTTKKTDPDTRAMSQVDFKFKRVAAMLNYSL